MKYKLLIGLLQSVLPRRRRTVPVHLPEILHPIVHLRLRVVVVEGLAYPAVVVDRRLEVRVLVGDPVLAPPGVEVVVGLAVRGQRSGKGGEGD